MKPAMLIALLVVMARLAAAEPADPQQTIRAVRAEELAVGIKSSGNFARSDPGVAAYYRCYYTGKLELPASYDELKLREGAKSGCPLDENKYDVFFYPIEAVSSGDVPVTQALAAASVERVATVVSHEDFHLQVSELPDRVAEAATTLVGFLAGSAAVENLGDTQLRLDADLFLRKAEILNRYYDRLSCVYRSARHGALSKPRALAEKRRLFTALQQECASIQPEPRSFNRCTPVANNAGLAFDYTYTRDYPLVYAVYQACRRDLPCTIEVFDRAPRKRPEAEVIRYLQAFARTATPR